MTIDEKIQRLWQLGLDTAQIAERLSMEEAEVSRGLIKWREKA